MLWPWWLKWGVVTVLLLVGLSRSQRGSYRLPVVSQDVLELPDLPYSYDALEPFIDAATLRVHHQGHHRAYCNKANAAVQEWRAQVCGDCEFYVH